VEAADPAGRGDTRIFTVVVARIEADGLARGDATGDQKLLRYRDVDAGGGDRSVTDADDEGYAGLRRHIGGPRKGRELGDERAGEQLHRADVGGLARSDRRIDFVAGI